MSSSLVNCSLVLPGYFGMVMRSSSNWSSAVQRAPGAAGRPRDGTARSGRGVGQVARCPARSWSARRTSRTRHRRSWSWRGRSSRPPSTVALNTASSARVRLGRRLGVDPVRRRQQQQRVLAHRATSVSKLTDRLRPLGAGRACVTRNLGHRVHRDRGVRPAAAGGLPSLKAKRSYVRPIVAALRRFEVAAAEVGLLDLHGRSRDRGGRGRRRRRPRRRGARLLRAAGLRPARGRGARRRAGACTARTTERGLRFRPGR